MIQSTDAYPESYPLGSPEGFAGEAGVDPTAQEVDEYREMVGDLPPESAVPDR